MDKDKTVCRFQANQAQTTGREIFALFTVLI